jgi:hypothetical protein
MDTISKFWFIKKLFGDVPRSLSKNRKLIFSPLMTCLPLREVGRKLIESEW